MSFSATCWAWSIDGLKSSEKLTLLAFCQYANEEKKVSYPSIDTISSCTGLNKKTVQTTIVKLIEKKLLIDTGKRVGKTLSCRVFHVPFIAYKELLEATPKTGTLDSEAIPNLGLSDPNFGQEAIPKTGSKPVIEPVNNQKKAFDVFWQNWTHCKKAIGMGNNYGSKKDAFEKFKSNFKPEKHDIDKIVDYMIDIYNDIYTSNEQGKESIYRNFIPMYPQKFIDRAIQHIEDMEITA